MAPSRVILRENTTSGLPVESIKRPKSSKLDETRRARWRNLNCHKHAAAATMNFCNAKLQSYPHSEPDALSPRWMHPRETTKTGESSSSFCPTAHSSQMLKNIKESRASRHLFYIEGRSIRRCHCRWKYNANLTDANVG
jgi:hypothetical protein